MALTGTNGDNQTNIQMSKSLEFSIYDKKKNEISVRNQIKPIELWIPRDTSLSIQPFKLVNALNATQKNETLAKLDGEQLQNASIISGFNLKGDNVSIHIQIKPNDTQIGYLSMLKFGENPELTANTKSYDLLNIFCPNDLKNESNESFYMLFANMSQVNGFKGYVGFSIREINLTQIDCFNKSLNSFDLILSKVTQSIENAQKTNQSGFTSNYWLRVYSSGCYYMNTSTNTWSSNGMDILEDSNLTHTHCISNHLTTFAGGLIVLPNAINFNKVWANASFLQNPVIYSTVIFLICLYILLGIWARYMDSKDDQKIGITLLPCDLNNDATTNKYIYEIIVFTGNRLYAGTKSKVAVLYLLREFTFQILDFLMI